MSFRSVRWSTRVFGLILVLGGLVGCDCGPLGCSRQLISFLNGKISFGEYLVAVSRGQAFPAKGEPKAKDTYVAFTAKKDGASGTVRPPRQVSGTFRVQCVIGSFDGKRADWGDGTVGVSILDPVGIGAAYHAIVLRRDGAGVEAQALAQGGITFEPVVFADTTLVQVAIERTQTEVIYLARGPGGGEFTEIGRLASSYSGAYIGSWDLSDLKRKSVVGIDSLDFVTSSDGGAEATAQERAYADALLAGRHLLRAAALLDGVGQDRTAGRAAIVSADEAVAAAQGELGGLSFSTKLLTKQLATSRKLLAKTLVRLDKGKPSAKAIGALRSAGRQLARAADRLGN